MRSEMNLFEHADALFVSNACTNDLLDVLIRQIQIVCIFDLPGLTANRELTLPLAVTPFRMGITDALHAKHEQRLEIDVRAAALEIE